MPRIRAFLMMSAIAACLAAGSVAQAQTARPGQPAQPAVGLSGVLLTGTDLDRAFGKFGLSPDAKDKINAALKNWSVLVAEAEYRDKMASVTKEFQQAKKDGDAAKIDELKAKRQKMFYACDPNTMTAEERYKSARAVVQPFLAAEQIAKLNERWDGVRTGTLLDYVLGDLGLTADAREKVNDALNNCKVLATDMALKDKRDSLTKAMKAAVAEGDEAKIKEITAKLKDLNATALADSQPKPRNRDLFQAAKAAIKPVLTAAQYDKIDDLLRGWVKDRTADSFHQWLSALEANVGPLTPDQKAQADILLGKAKDKLTVVMTSTPPVSAGMTFGPDYTAPVDEAKEQFLAAVLTGEQKAKVPDRMKPGNRPTLPVP